MNLKLVEFISEEDYHEDRVFLGDNLIGAICRLSVESLQSYGFNIDKPWIYSFTDQSSDWPSSTPKFIVQPHPCPESYKTFQEAKDAFVSGILDAL